MLAAAQWGVAISCCGVQPASRAASCFLQADDLAPALEALRRKLMERNVASEIADK